VGLAAGFFCCCADADALNAQLANRTMKMRNKAVLFIGPYR
jgi:hypothetical protein